MWESGDSVIVIYVVLRNYNEQLSHKFIYVSHILTVSSRHLNIRVMRQSVDFNVIANINFTD